MTTGTGENKRLMTNAGGGVEIGIGPVLGNNLTVNYHGMLAGTDALWLRAGYGQERTWKHVYDLPMVRTEDGSWEAILRRTSGEQVNLCFHDDAGHWDNNNGQNWSFAIEQAHL
jgi:hypothetical protein